MKIRADHSTFIVTRVSRCERYFYTFSPVQARILVTPRDTAGYTRSTAFSSVSARCWGNALSRLWMSRVSTNFLNAAIIFSPHFPLKPRPHLPSRRRRASRREPAAARGALSRAPTCPARAAQFNDSHFVSDKQTVPWHWRVACKASRVTRVQLHNGGPVASSGNITALHEVNRCVWRREWSRGFRDWFFSTCDSFQCRLEHRDPRRSHTDRGQIVTRIEA